MSDELNSVKQEIDGGRRVITLSGLTSIAAKAYVLARVQAETGRKFAVVTDTNSDLEVWASDLRFWLNSALRPPHSALAFLPSFETDPYSGVSPHAETEERRALALWQLSKGGGDIVVLSARSLVQRTVTSGEITALGCELERDAELPPDELIARLTSGGYVREEPLFGPGQFSVRGGIVDVWSPDADAPVRIEFFGDTVESIRSFDAETQLSVEQLASARIAPIREFAVSPQDLKDWSSFARERFQTTHSHGT